MRKRAMREAYPTLEVAARAAHLTEKVIRSELRTEMSRQNISRDEMVARTGLPDREIDAILGEAQEPLNLEQLYRAAYAAGRTLMVSMI